MRHLLVIWKRSFLRRKSPLPAVNSSFLDDGLIATFATFSTLMDHDKIQHYDHGVNSLGQVS